MPSEHRPRTTALLLTAILALAACSGGGGGGDPAADAADDAWEADGGGPLDAAAADIGGRADVAPPGMPDEWSAFPLTAGARQFTAIHVVAPDDVWLGTTDGLYHLDGASLRRAELAGIFAVGAIAAGGGKLWAVGSSDGRWRIASFDGETWTDLDYEAFTNERPGHLVDASVVGPNVYVSDGSAPYVYDPTAILDTPNIYQLQGSAGDDLGRLFARSDDEVWLTGGRWAYRFDGRSTGRWNFDRGERDASVLPFDFTLRDVHGRPGALWYAGGSEDEGLGLVHYDGRTAVTHRNGLLPGAHRVWVAEDGAVWFGGEGGLLGRYADGDWGQAPLGTVQTVWGISGAEGAVFAVTNGRIFRCRGAGCDALDPVEEPPPPPDGPRVRFASACDGQAMQLCWGAVGDAEATDLVVERAAGSELTSTGWLPAPEDDALDVLASAPEHGCGGGRFAHHGTFAATPGSRTTVVAKPLFRADRPETEVIVLPYDDTAPRGGQARVTFVNALGRVRTLGQAYIDLCDAAGAPLAAYVPNGGTLDGDPVVTLHLPAGDHDLGVHSAIPDAPCAVPAYGLGRVTLEADARYLLILESSDDFADQTFQLCRDEPEGGALDCARVPLPTRDF